MIKRVLIYGRGNGLGHLRRCHNIALALLAQKPDCSILVLADEYSTPFFDAVSGVDVIKLPSIKRVDQHSNWESGTLNYSAEQIFQLRENLILGAALPVVLTI